jgi:hypothetical protein
MPTPPVSDSSNIIANNNGLEQTSTNPSIQPPILPQGQPVPEINSSVHSLDVIQSMIDAPNSLDWVSYPLPPPTHIQLLMEIAHLGWPYARL